MARPTKIGAPRNRQLTCGVTENERAEVDAAVKVSGKSLTDYIRDAVLGMARGSFQSGNYQLESKGKTPKPSFQSGNSGVFKVETPKNGVEIAEQEQPVIEPFQTRADAGSRARTQKEERDLDLSDSSSLRSSQASPPVSDEEPWSEPSPLRQSIRLTSGDIATNTWLFANGSKIPAPDVLRLLQTPSLKPLKMSMLHCFARSLRDCYRLRWCSAYNKRLNAWRDTPRSNKAFLRAAELLAIEYASRGMNSNQFIDACDEMRPKALRFVSVDMLGSTIGPRVADWIPPEQRQRSKLGDSHVDTDGTQWITPDGESQPVVVLRTVADKEKFLRQIKVK